MAKTKLTDHQILTIVTNELSNANVTSSSPTFLRDPLGYYLGLPNGKEVEGRSGLTSLDVADAIEWIMPQIMKAFTQNNEVVIFDPVRPGDEKQADLESQYVYDILMKKNNGFILIHQFVKDALMQRNGVLKVYYEEIEETRTDEYTGLTQEQMQMLVADKDVEILEMTTNSLTIENSSIDGLPNLSSINEYDVKIVITKKVGKICIDPVPLEQFRVNSQHNSIALNDARFTAHIITKSASDLLEEGYDEDLVAKLASTDLIRSAYRFYMQNEPTLIPATFPGDESSKLVEIGECYLKCDRNGDGIAERLKVTTGGVQPATVILDIDELDDNPWVSCTAILMSHKFQGMSIYDRLKQIQDNKTALIRNIMDNVYLQNNQRNIVVEGQVNIDDLLVSRPGGIIRAKRLDAIAPLQTPPISPAAMEMMNYLDTVRAGRVGVSPEGQVNTEQIGDRVGSEGIEAVMNAKEELVGLIVRVICETGIKPLMCKIRDIATKHFDSIEDYKFRGEWVQVRPTSWIKRSETTVRVGTGSGDHRAKQAAIQNIAAIQEKLVAANQPLTNPDKIYATLDDLCKFSGLNGASRYFIDPSSPEGQQATQQASQQAQAAQQKQEQMTIEQMRQQAELAKSATTVAESQQMNVKLKGEVELAKHQHAMDKLSLQAQNDALKHELAQAKLMADAISKKTDSDKNRDLEYDKLHMNTAVELVKVEAQSKQDQTENFLAAQQAAESEEESEGGENND
jgi:hypothetical protein